MMFSQFTFLWIIFAIVDSHSLLTEKKAEDGISVKSEIVINNLQNQINQETVIRLSLLKQVYSLVNDMINVKNEMASMKTNTAEIRKSTDDLRHEDNKMLNEIAQMKQDHNNKSEIIINEQNEHDKMLSELKQKMKINQNDTSERMINYKREYEIFFSEIEQKMKFDHKDTSERIAKAQLEYKTMFKKFEQNMKSNQDDTSERIVNIKKDLLNVNNSVGLLHNYTDKINSKYGIQEKTVRDLVSELEKIRGRLGVLHNESERMRSETQRMLVNYNETTLKMRDDLRNITSMVDSLNLFQFKDCLESSHCWLLYSFDYDNSWNGCEGGAQYVKKTNYSSAPYLGVMICSSKRYKLFLSKILTGKYYNIADGGGTGEDHCELLGTTQRGKLPGDFEKSANTQGFYRSSRGENFSFGAIGYRPSQTSMWYEKWIECSVNIPGNNRVIPM
ncbi:major antigen-like isoform X3 [Saccostrea cucullata]|uniref:major antigen-like isoform X3 n=1 Tax=Saccostrea cuccullata TaxID=36930 RepID=UPI002ED23E74